MNDLAKSAGSHGLWIGMFSEFSEELINARNSVLEQNSDLFNEIIEPTKLHITIAHLGRNNPVKRTEAAAEAMNMASSTVYGDHRISVEGLIRLPNHLGLLLVPDRILGIRNQLAGCLRDRGITMDDRFAGVPHMTIGKFKYDSDMPKCPRIKPFTLTFRSLTIIAGDIREHAPFSEPPF